VRRISAHLGALAFAAALAAAAPAAAAPTRYSLAGSCRAVTAGGQTVAPGPLRMQAVTLGRYLLYTPGRTFIVDKATGTLGTSGAPSSAAEWTVDGTSGSFTLTNRETGRTLPATFPAATGCADYPEAGIDATGTTFKGADPDGVVQGTVDAHAHITAFEFIGGNFHCGRPWHPYGVAYALPDCAKIQGLAGLAAPVQNFLDFGSPVAPHDTVGWPTFKDWPGPNRLTYEGDYYTGLKRAWMGGLRIFVTDLVDNEALCSIMTNRRNPCDDMAAVRLQDEDLDKLQDYIDAQAGGPGKGFFRLVTNPFQARRVINQGKLAVIEGVEVSRILGCGEVNHNSQCTRADVAAGLDELRSRGVTTFFPVHKFDNAFGGTKMDAGELGAIINAGNHLKTNHFWDVQTCTGPEHDSEQLTVPISGALAQLFAGPLHGLLPSGTLPVYPPGPHCNQQGLTDLGRYLLSRMIDKHIVLQLDHMDAKTADAALDVAERHHYPGVVSAHSWDSPEENPRIYALGGFITPITGSSPAAYLDQWQRDRQDPNYPHGFGYGSDMNGLAQQSAPAGSDPITYPFQSYAGDVTFSREVWGQRTFDLNTDGLANYGMYPDWMEQLRHLAGPAFTADMMNGAERYLEMWERAQGVPAAKAVAATAAFGPAGLGDVRVGEGGRSLLFRAGQPAQRTGTAYAWSVRGAGPALRVALSPSGTVGLVTSSAAGHAAGGVHPGDPVSALRTRATAAGAGLWLGARGSAGRRTVYGTRDGRVTWVGVAGRSAGAGAGSARAYARRAGLVP
jgi:hypothetical protein